LGNDTPQPAREMNRLSNGRASLSGLRQNAKPKQRRGVPREGYSRSKKHGPTLSLGQRTCSSKDCWEGGGKKKKGFGRTRERLGTVGKEGEEFPGKGER